MLPNEAYRRDAETVSELEQDDNIGARERRREQERRWIIPRANSSSNSSRSSSESGYHSLSPLRARRPASVSDGGESLSPQCSISDDSEGHETEEEMDSI